MTTAAALETLARYVAGARTSEGRAARLNHIRAMARMLRSLRDAAPVVRA